MIRKFCLSVIVIFALLIVKSSNAQDDKNLDMRFNIESVNMGELHEEKGDRTVTFEFTNVGSGPIIINTISVSCGCTTVSYSREPIMPDQKSKIEITYDPAGRPGFFEKKIYILSENRRKENILTITGRVLPRPLSISDKYPYTLGAGVISSSSTIEFGQIPIGHSHTLSLNIYNNSDKEVSLSVPRAPSGGEFSYYIANPKLKPKQMTQLLVTIDIEKSIICSLIDEQITIFINGHSYASSRVKVEGVTIPDNSKEFKSGEPTPAIYLSDVYHNFSTTYESQKPIKEFMIENEGNSELKIKQIIVSDSNRISYNIESTTIKPMSYTTIKIQFKPDGKLGPFNGNVMIISNDPSFPLSEIHINANVKEDVKSYSNTTAQ